MKKLCLFLSAFFLTVFAGCSSSPGPDGNTNNVAIQKKSMTPVLASSSEVRALRPTDAQLAALASDGYPITEAKVVNMADIAAQADLSASTTGAPIVVGGEFIESPMSDDEVRAAAAFAQANAPGGNIQALADGSDDLDVNNNGKGKGIGKKGPKLRKVIDSIGAEDCCIGVPFTATVPPDPDMAVGPDHMIAVVNVTFEIYDKEGNVLQSAMPYGFLFAGVEPIFDACNGPFPFDPDVVYDESIGQFIMGVDGGGAFYCIGITTTGDPTGTWNLYAFLANAGFTEFFDFPHMGVGVDAIFVGSNQFAAGFVGSAVFAVKKADLIAGGPLTVVRQNVPRFDSTPQPANLHGVAEGTFPTSGPHYIMTEVFDGIHHSVYEWNDPFGANVFSLTGDVDLAAASGVACPAFACFPIPVPQAGSAVTLASNDWRGQETEFRNGSLWTTQTISCNPGSGAVNCVRWAEIDPTSVVPGPVDGAGFLISATTNGVIQAGVFSSDDGTHRWFPSITANACGDMAIGYSKSSLSMFPSVALTGRRRTDLPGQVRAEVDVIAGTESYRSFQNPALPNRWGDYSGMTIDPNGKDFWYIGEYAASSTNPFANWQNVIAKTNFGCGLGKPKNK